MVENKDYLSNKGLVVMQENSIEKNQLPKRDKSEEGQDDGGAQEFNRKKLTS